MKFHNGVRSACICGHLRFPLFAVALCLAIAVAAPALAQEPPPLPDILEGVQDIVFLGDSLTDGSSYPDFVVNSLNRTWPGKGFTLHNAGVCGDTSANLVERLQRDVLDQDPDLVSVCIGANDVILGRAVEEYARDLDTVVSRILESGARVLIVLTSPLQKAEWEDKLGLCLDEARRIAKEHNLVTADAHALFLDWKEKGRDMLGPDGIHHGEDGFEGMARAILDGLGLDAVPVDTVVRPWPHLLIEWEASAPIPAANKPYDPTLVTEWQAYDRQAAIAEQPWYDAPFAARGAWMPFALKKPKTPSVAFARTTYNAPRAGTYELRTGGSLPLIVWINGEKIWEDPPRRAGVHPNVNRTPVRLREGDNEIVVLNNYIAFVGIRPLDL